MKYFLLQIYEEEKLPLENAEILLSSNTRSSVGPTTMNDDLQVNITKDLDFMNSSSGFGNIHDMADNVLSTTSSPIWIDEVSYKN